MATLGLIATKHALTQTDKYLHFLAADVRKTAQAIIYAAVYGQARLFYPYLLAIIPPLYYIFNPLWNCSVIIRLVIKCFYATNKKLFKLLKCPRHATIIPF